MGIAIIGCAAIRNELEIVTAGDPDVVHREYLEFGLHLEPEDLRRTIMEKLESLPPGADVVFLGYGHCQTLQGLPERTDVPVVMLEYGIRGLHRRAADDRAISRREEERRLDLVLPRWMGRRWHPWHGEIVPSGLCGVICARILPQDDVRRVLSMPVHRHGDRVLGTMREELARAGAGPRPQA